MKKCYITTAIDYVNSRPHIGTAFEKIGADAYARFKRLTGHDVFFLMGNDEHSINVFKEAKKQNLDPLAYCDQMEKVFTSVWKSLNLSYDTFIRTTSDRHKKAVREIFRRCKERGDIYKGTYKGFYCNSCEAYKKSSDLEQGKCSTHKIPAVAVEEENYFFTLSRYVHDIKEHIKVNPEFIRPETRRNEILSFLESGVEDVSITRARTDWGIPVPGDETHSIYVWFDALINYITGVGFPEDIEMFNRYWPADIHFIGKDITRFHCVIWPAMLMSAGVDVPISVYAHGFIYVNEAKLSKTTGNIVDPMEVVAKYGGDTLRYYLLREAPFGGDGNFTWASIDERYHADLGNDLGNLVNRTLNMIQKFLNGTLTVPSSCDDQGHAIKAAVLQLPDFVEKSVNRCEFNEALIKIWEVVRALNSYVDKSAPWTLAKMGESEQVNSIMYTIVESLKTISITLAPFMPETSAKIWDAIGLQAYSDFARVQFDYAKTWGYVKDGTTPKPSVILFPRLEQRSVPDKSEKK